MSVQSEVLKFGGNIVLRAGAGTGKTETLTTLYLFLCTGCTQLASGSDITPDRIVASTFSEKAAAEMRDRIRGNLLWLTHQTGPAPRAALELLAELKRLGRSSQPETFVKLLDEFAYARIQTLHSLCASIVRANAIELGLDPAFTLLDERESKRLFEDSALAALTDALESKDPAFEALYNNFTQLRGGRRDGLLDALESAHSELSEATGERLRATQSHWSTERHWRDCATQLAATLGIGVEAILAGDVEAFWLALQPSSPTGDKTRDKKLAARNEKLAELRSRPLFGTPSPSALFEVLSELGDKELQASMSSAWAIAPSREIGLGFLDLLERVSARFAAKKSELGVADFSDLVRFAVRALSSFPQARRAYVDGLDALLVDEAQDLNRTQKELIYLLRAADAHQTGHVPFADLRRSGLFVVGDRKQSIYGFRGADVGVFEEIAAEVRELGGQDLALQNNYRSDARLLEGLNQLAAQTFSTTATHDFEFSFEPTTETLTAPRAAVLLDAPIEVIHLEERGLGPEVVAAWIEDLIANARPVRDKQGGARPARYGDIAILLRSFTHIGQYLRALEISGIPHRTDKGRGLLRTLEARDIASALRVLLHVDHDGIALLSLLRGPFLGLSDEVLRRIAGFRPKIWRDLRAEDLTAPQDQAIRHFVTLLRQRSLEAERLGASRTLERLIDDVGYRAVVSCLPGAEQRLSNLDKILGHLHALENGSLAGGREALLGWLARVADTEQEPEADVATEDGNVVRLMTVHQSKGLQFPVVIAAELGLSRGGDNSRALMTRDGLTVKVVAPSSKLVRAEPSGGADVIAISKLRGAAENRRIFYVQITRAEDRLLLVGNPKAGTLKEFVAPVLGGLEQSGLAQRRDAGELLSARERRLKPTTSSPHQEVSALQPIQRGNVGRVQWQELAVTQLEDLVLCARRFRAKHLLRLEERPKPPRIEEEAEEGQHEELSARERGTLVHALLEHMDFTQAQLEPEAAIDAASMNVLGRNGGTLDLDAKNRVAQFLGTAFARSLGSCRDVRRELAFRYAVQTKANDSVLLSGTIDALADFGDHLMVIDYKTAKPRGKNPADAYRLQLTAYERALQAMGETRAIRLCIVFLDGAAREPVYVKADRSFEDKLSRAIASLVPQSRSLPVLAEATCHAAKCGYTWLCHRRLI